MDAETKTPIAVNEPIAQYAPGSPERSELQAELQKLASATPVDLPAYIGGSVTMGGGTRIKVIQPHAHSEVLGVMRNSTAANAKEAIDAARKAAPAWREMSFDDRAAIFLKAADLLAGPWRATLNAATMLGQSKTAIQAEIDSACELIDFWRFNVGFADDILRQQPESSRGVWNRTDHRPLEGFVYAITPFNFTAIAGNLPTAPALMGNVVVWKPAHSQQFAANFLMQLLVEAGLPDGVINMLPGDGIAVSKVVLASPDLAGIHFTGSTGVFQMLWGEIGKNISNYRTYPRIVGETGGKDFVVAHPSADPDVLRTALVRGAFEYQGQKCSAASRAYIPRSIWKTMKKDFIDEVQSLSMGPVTDLSNFMGAVIDQKAFDRVTAAIERGRRNSSVTVIAGGEYDDSEGYFIRPTVLLGTDPTAEFFRDEYFGPLLSVHVFDDRRWSSTLDSIDSASPYALTGSVISQDREAIAEVADRLRFTAGNFYINDKPTGAVVGQQPFGGARASGTNDKAGSPANLTRWTSARSIKETFVPAVESGHPHMG
ncbi:MAG: L-glutamate gamma-semialdehyde dehydrogenase [Candidatus Nanopelagicales bacterium]